MYRDDTNDDIWSEDEFDGDGCVDDVVGLVILGCDNCEMDSDNDDIGDDAAAADDDDNAGEDGFGNDCVGGDAVC